MDPIEEINAAITEIHRSVTTAPGWLWYYDFDLGEWVFFRSKGKEKRPPYSGRPVLV
jgi:hypothetical protein